MVTSLKRLGPEKDCAGENQQHIKNRPVRSLEREPQKNKTVTVKE
jgi:hypothetical protein